MRIRTSFLEDFAILLCSCRPACPGLADLLAQEFAGVPDALVLVWVGRTQCPDIRGYLADHLLVISTEHQVGLLVDLELDSGRQQNLNGVRIAQRESGDVTLHVGAIAHARDIQLPGKSRGDALYGRRSQGTR